MKLVTRHFGEIELDEDLIIEFEKGIPGFNDLKKFCILHDNDSDTDDNGEESPFRWLQSAEDGDVCFVLMDALKVYPDYNPIVDDEELEELGEYVPDNFLLFNIARFPADMKDASVNLKAPVLINHVLKKGKQVVCTNDEYTVRHFIFK